jgi:hypothetical protein
VAAAIVARRFQQVEAGGSPVEHEPMGEMIEAGMGTCRRKIPVPCTPGPFRPMSTAKGRMKSCPRGALE